MKFSDRDIEMSSEDMAIFTKENKKLFKRKKEDQSSSVDKNERKSFDTTKFVRKFSDKFGQK